MEEDKNIEQYSIKIDSVYNIGEYKDISSSHK